MCIRDRGIPVHLHPPAHLGQLLLHGSDAVGFLDAQASGIADGGGAAAQAAQRNEHRAQVGAVGQVDVPRLHQAAGKPQGAVDVGNLAAAALEDIQDCLLYTSRCV